MQKLPKRPFWQILSTKGDERVNQTAACGWSFPVCVWRQKPYCCWNGEGLAWGQRNLPQWWEDFPDLGQWGRPTENHFHAKGWRCQCCFWKTGKRHCCCGRFYYKGIWQIILLGCQIWIYPLMSYQSWNWYESLCPCWPTWMDKA